MFEPPRPTFSVSPPHNWTLPPTRYDGGGFGVEMAAFHEEDAGLLRRVHDHAQEVYVTWLRVRDRRDWSALHSRCEALGHGNFSGMGSRLGVETLATDPPKDVRNVLHDVRGGALAAMILEAHLLAGPDDFEALERIALLGRDHAKMMRNAVVDLDTALRDADKTEKPHSVADLLARWDDRPYPSKDGPRVQVDLLTDAGVATRCLEASAVDRVLYNLLNNAVRHTADDRVRIACWDADEGLLQFVVTNSVRPEERTWLEKKVGADSLAALFSRGVTHGGTGIGMHNVASFVAAAFGMRNGGIAVSKGYAGASIDGAGFHAWFHWPAAPSEKRTES